MDLSRVDRPRHDHLQFGVPLPPHLDLVLPAEITEERPVIRFELSGAGNRSTLMGHAPHVADEEKAFEEMTPAEHFEHIRALVTDLGRILRDSDLGVRVAAEVVRHAQALLAQGPGGTAPR
jgi:hypothetical protein